jgi:hypothetical protein
MGQFLPIRDNGDPAAAAPRHSPPSSVPRAAPQLLPMLSSERRLPAPVSDCKCPHGDRRGDAPRSATR